MKTSSLLVGVLFTASVGYGVGCAVKEAEKGAEPKPKEAQAKKAEAPAADAKKRDDVFKVPVGNSYQKGPKDALVTIVEFSDFQCPFCGKVGPTLKQIESTYGDKVRIVFKHQPLPFHKQAPLASEYALAAGEQGKFWEMHDKLFANQRQLTEDDLKKYAAELQLNQGKIDAFIASGKGKQAIKEDQALAMQIGARGTPAFYINGVKLSGAQPFPNFQKVIDAELANAQKLVDGGVAKAEGYAAVIKDGRTSPPPAPKPQAPTRQKVELADTTPMKGAKDALVTIVEFSDFQCPFCSRVNPTLKQIMDTYKGKVQIRFRNQPLGFHKRAMPAAKAALAAGEQGKYWEMHDKLFENQKALEDSDLENYAKQLGLNLKKFKADMASPKIADIIKKDQQDAAKYGARGTPTLFVNGVPVRGAQPFPRFKSIIDEEIAFAEKLLKEGVNKSDIYKEIIKRKGGEEVAQAQQPSAPPVPSKPVNIEIGKAPTYGPKNAPVKVVVYSDFECPFCGRVNPSIEQIKKEYKGKVSVSFKHYPLPFHKNAKPAAIASLAAHRQGKFWEMHDLLFSNQRALSRADLVGYAKKLGLNTGKFEKDLDDPALAKWVDQDMAEGAKVGVRGTPASFINGRLVSGAQPFPAFKAIIEEELKKNQKS